DQRKHVVREWQRLIGIATDGRASRRRETRGEPELPEKQIGEHGARDRRAGATLKTGQYPRQVSRPAAEIQAAAGDSPLLLADGVQEAFGHGIRGIREPVGEILSL